ncbi:MAG: threonine aldolase family protein [Fimbriimonadaceae bacterium]|nr:threonine aldolase family protein [Fimbriimonadaceae bacterium]QYK59199.1 MAG: threonine aldolase family protein [Fimbriimonadaceae bacterium]
MTVDLRSDTVTRPTPTMYEAIAKAELGDDVLGHDPTVLRLERMAAERLGKEEGLFFPSGTMANQAAIAAQTRPGDSILADEDAHILFYEGAGPSVFSAVQARSYPSQNGRPDPIEIESRILTSSHHTPGTTLLCLENSHNRAGGAVTPLKILLQIREVAERRGLKVHLDGARLFNAATALREDPADLASIADTVMVSLSKGLCSPVGSLLCGSSETIEAARFWRKRMGGGMRQSGILAACGIVSLSEMTERLDEDHGRTKALGDSLKNVPGLTPHEPETNILMVDTQLPADTWVSKMTQRDVLVYAFGAHRLRLVLHRDVDDVGLGHAIAAFKDLGRELEG